MDGWMKTWGKNKTVFPEDFLFPGKLENFSLRVEAAKEVFIDPFSSSTPSHPCRQKEERSMISLICSEKKPLSWVKRFTWPYIFSPAPWITIHSTWKPLIQSNHRFGRTGRSCYAFEISFLLSTFTKKLGTFYDFWLSSLFFVMILRERTDFFWLDANKRQSTLLS